MSNNEGNFKLFAITYINGIVTQHFKSYSECHCDNVVMLSV
jgi:hypothetical protein